VGSLLAAAYSSASSSPPHFSPDTQLILLVFSNGIRLILSSCNRIVSACSVGQVMFFQDFPHKCPPTSSAGDGFEEYLAAVIKVRGGKGKKGGEVEQRAGGCDDVLQHHTQTKPRSTTQSYKLAPAHEAVFISHIRRTDFSAARCDLVASAPGFHAYSHAGG